MASAGLRYVGCCVDAAFWRRWFRPGDMPVVESQLEPMRRNNRKPSSTCNHFELQFDSGRSAERHTGRRDADQLKSECQPLVSAADQPERQPTQDDIIWKTRSRSTSGFCSMKIHLTA